MSLVLLIQSRTLSDRMVNFLLAERSHVSDCDLILERAYYGY
jgi:hypothetical protein